MFNSFILIVIGVLHTLPQLLYSSLSTHDAWNVYILSLLVIITVQSFYMFMNAYKRYNKIAIGLLLVVNLLFLGHYLNSMEGEAYNPLMLILG